jgi:hypothetical protein
VGEGLTFVNDDFDPAYVDNVIVPFLNSKTYKGERLSLPIIDVAFSKENAVAPHLWGMLSATWKPCPEDGVTVFLQGLENRGPGNLRKKIYLSALTPDLYEPMYATKVRHFFDVLLADENAGRPLMREYLDGYFDLYWDLHVGATGDAIPSQVRQIGHSFNAVLAYRDPTLRTCYENYMTVRAHREYLKGWIADRVADVIDGRAMCPQKTFVHYWMKNGSREYFSREDVVFECFHNFVAFSQWGKTLFLIMSKLQHDGDPEVRHWFEKTMRGNFDEAVQGCPFTPLERFVMELFRTISPNPGSISVIAETQAPSAHAQALVISPHAATSFDLCHWRDPAKFDPDRYLNAPTSDEVDDIWCRRIGFARRPFDAAPFEVTDGRSAALHSSGFGTVYGVVDGESLPVCDYAGYAPFGFGYRRCPGERFTISVFCDFLKAVWARKIEFTRLPLANPAQVPVGPGTVIGDSIGFTYVTGAGHSHAG